MIANIAEYRVCCEKFRNIQSSFKMLRVVECIESKVRIILKVFSLKFITNLTPENRNQVKCWYSLSSPFQALLIFQHSTEIKSLFKLYGFNRFCSSYLYEFQISSFACAVSWKQKVILNRFQLIIFTISKTHVHIQSLVEQKVPLFVTTDPPLFSLCFSAKY